VTGRPRSPSPPAVEGHVRRCLCHNGTVPKRPAPKAASSATGSASRGDGADLTVVAIPFYFATMALEYAWLRRRAARRGGSPADYERRDTVASLTMGVLSLLAPVVGPRLLRPFTPGRGRAARVVVGSAVGAVAITTVADAVVRRAERRAASVADSPSQGPSVLDRTAAEYLDESAAVRAARKVAAVGGVTAVVAGGVAVTTTWATRTTPERLFRRRLLPDAGRGPLALAAAIAGWDFLYYWDHRFMHTSRYMWAIHVVHHSSEHYNLSTALRQPVAEAFGTFVPFGSLCLLGIRPGLVETARGVNLLYQYWIHTETVGSLGPGEAVLNTPSHHRVHHGSNKRYLDRNHGSILIVWDKVFGTFEPETERVVYGLTKNINTFQPWRIATHEYAQMLRDVASSTSWRERLSYVVRGPGWATEHRAQRQSTTPQLGPPGRRQPNDAVAVGA
jgi:sterol desaturase/sphingolipid hydroxylase (fatty acid hydroxylase superfamily)